MAVPQNIQSVALQIEKINKNVPRAFLEEHILMDMIDERGEVIEASTRNIRLPQLIRPGGKGSQGTGDFDDMGRGSGSTWDVGTLTTMQFRWAFEVSKLAEYATDGSEKALEDVAVQEVKEAVRNFKTFLDVVYNTNGTGQCDTILAISGTTVTVRNANMFYYNQDVQVYPTGLGSASRGLATVTFVDPTNNTIGLNALPGGTIVGDALVINISQGAGGANPISLEGLLYNHVDATTGTWNNLARSSYPEALKTPHVAGGNAAITPGIRRLGENKLRRVLGAKFETEDAVAYWNVDQEAAWENTAVAVSEIIRGMGADTGDSTVDLLKRRPPKTFGGFKALTSIHATNGRIDVILPKHWGRGVTKEFGPWTLGGQTVFQIYGASGAPVNGYWSAYDVVFNVFMDQPRYGLFFDGLAVPTGY